METMPKRRKWSSKEEKQLVELVEKGCSAPEISEKIGRSYSSVSSKMKRLGISSNDDDRCKKNNLSLSSTLKLPENLPSIEDQLRVLAGVIDALREPGLAKGEVMRLRTMINGIRAYKEQFADYVGYRQIEKQVEQLIEELRRVEGAEELEGKKQQKQSADSS